MNRFRFSKILKDRYKELEPQIKARLEDFASVPPKDYFYEMCFCICTPQSKARSADLVIGKLKERRFFEKPFDPTEILRHPDHYIRFHNSKAERLLTARDVFPAVLKVLNSKESAFEKREKILELVNGYGLKEASHFMRNIGYRGLAILDRHILRNMLECNVFDELPKVGSRRQYYTAENKFIEFSRFTGIDIDELDLLFWSNQTGEILK